MPRSVGGVDDAGGAGAEAQGIHAVAQAVDCIGHVEGTIVDRRQDQIARCMAGLRA